MPRMLTTEEFIFRSNHIHNNKYDYSKVKYTRSNDEVIIICPNHGEFSQISRSHLHGSGCKKCYHDSIRNKSFIAEAIQIHGNKYDYSNVKYINNCTNVIITCPIHGSFNQTPSVHLRGSGCTECQLDSIRISNSEYISKVNIIHSNKYIYNNLNFNTIKEYINITCPEHGEFRQTAQRHMNGQGCPKCKADKSKLSLDEFITRSNDIHRNIYDYSKVEYLGHMINVCIVCKEHGEFYQMPNKHLQGQGCPRCKESKGERKIRQYLDDNNIKYECEYCITECRNKQLLPFDFYIPSHNLLIEYDGEQHFKPVSYFGGIKKFKTQQYNDNIKNKFINNSNKFKLLRISYLDIDNIETILKKAGV